MIISKTSVSPIRYFRDGTEITEAEYNKTLQCMKNKPLAPAGYDYRLNEKLEWEMFARDDVLYSGEEISAEDALAELVEVLE